MLELRLLTGGEHHSDGLPFKELEDILPISFFAFLGFLHHTIDKFKGKHPTNHTVAPGQFSGLG